MKSSDDRDAIFLNNLVNCILSNPFYRSKVVESNLIQWRITTISNKQVLFDQFISIVLKTFPHSSSTTCGNPVTMFTLLIGGADYMNEGQWLVQLKCLFKLSDEQVKIRFDANYSSKDIFIEEELCDLVMRKYTQFYPCSFIMDIMDNNKNTSPSTSSSSHLDNAISIIVVPSTIAKHFTIEKLKVYTDYYIKSESQY